MQPIRTLFAKINCFLDGYILPWPVRFLTFRFVILLTIALLIPLILFADNTVLVLGINSYLNTMSVAVSSIVLLYATISEIRQKQIAELQEKRAQEDHQHVTEMHNLVLQSLHNQDKEIAELKQLLAALSGKEVVIREPLPLPNVHALHPRGAERFAEHDSERRLKSKLHPNALVASIREGMSSEKRKPLGEGGEKRPARIESHSGGR